MGNENLDAETRLAVQSEFGRILTRAGTLFGVANIAVVSGAPRFM